MRIVLFATALMIGGSSAAIAQTTTDGSTVNAKTKMEARSKMGSKHYSHYRGRHKGAMAMHEKSMKPKTNADTNADADVNADVNVTTGDENADVNTSAMTHDQMVEPTPGDKVAPMTPAEPATTTSGTTETQSSTEAETQSPPGLR